MTTCYDVRFPELYRLFVDQGAEIVVIPTGWPAARLEHWQILTRARAIENQVFLIGCNQVGTQEGVQLAGHSVVIDPWGRVLAEGGVNEEIITVDIDPALVAKTRAEFPVLRDRRLGPPTSGEVGEGQRAADLAIAQDPERRLDLFVPQHPGRRAAALRDEETRRLRRILRTRQPVDAKSPSNAT